MKCACILAAGMGSRLKKLTQDNTKCMISVNEEKLIDTILETLISAGIDNVYVVTGYQAENLEIYLNQKYPNTNLTFIRNDIYATTNNIYSFKLALPFVCKHDEIILIESDLWIDKDTAINFIQDTRQNVVLASPFKYWMDGTCVTLDDTNSNKISNFVAKQNIHKFQHHELYKTVNWYKFSSTFLINVYSNFVNAYVDSFGSNAYYEDVLKVISSANTSLFEIHLISEDKWMEIDDEEDLRRAEIIASNELAKTAKLANLFGGYWKYSDIKDLTLLVNPYFPTEAMMDELIFVSREALRQYPSKLSTIEKIAAKSLPVDPKDIIVGNGASELMHHLFNAIDSDLSFSIAPPYFLEYKRLLGDRLTSINRDFPKNNLEQTISKFIPGSINHLIIVNPNNPTGEIITKCYIKSILSELVVKNRLLIVDESFMDFSSSNQSIIDPDIIAEFPNLVIIKSFGKSYGVPGVRLGVLISSNSELKEKIRSSLPIWNISSAAEVFLDLLPRYKNEYKHALNQIRSQRDRLESHLTQLDVDLIPSNANFIFFSFKSTTKQDFQTFAFNRGLLVKSIALREGLSKIYYRVAVLSENENQYFINVLNEFLNTN